MNLKYLTSSASLISAILVASPPDRIPDELLNDFTLNGEIPYSYTYYDGTYSSDDPIIYKKEEVNHYLNNALNRIPGYYGGTDIALYELMDAYSAHFQNKTVGIIGSVKPLYEGIILAYGGHPVTIEYNKIITDDDRLMLLTPKEYEESPLIFDVILSISSIEHDGLGRYGDPIDPYGDIKSMKTMKTMLKEDGLLFIAFPYAEEDHLSWNAHRIYGPIRLPMLFDGWDQIDFASAEFQPVFVLKPKL